MGQGWKYTISSIHKSFLRTWRKSELKDRQSYPPVLLGSTHESCQMQSKLVHHFAANVSFKWQFFVWYIGLEKIHQFKLAGDYLVSWSSVLSMVGEILPAFEILILTHNNRIGIKETFEILILPHDYRIGMKDILKRLILRYFEHLYTASTSSLR